MKKLIAALTLCLFTGCGQGEAIPQTKITEDAHLRIIKVKSDNILVVELQAPSQEWPNVKSCDDYDVLDISHGTRSYSQGRGSYYTRSVEVFHLKPKRNFVIDWRYKSGGDNRWFRTEIRVE